MKLTHILTLLLLPALLFTACRDEEVFSGGIASGLSTRSDLPESNAGLKQNADGTYSPDNGRVPLVGEGRIINQMTKNLVSVLSDENHLDYLIDTNLDNAVSFKGAVGVALGEPILSVRDLNRVYRPVDGAQSIKAGFVYRATNASLLNLDVLNGFWIKTYLKGAPQESSVSDGEGSSQLLKLSLLNTNGGNREVQIEATKPFDEIQFGNAGISLDVLGSLEVLYAYVGENPEKIAAKGQAFSDATVDVSSSVKADVIPVVGNGAGLVYGNLVDENLTNKAVLPKLLVIDTPAWFEVDFHEDIPKGAEVGFKAGGFTIVNADLGDLYVSTLNSEDTEISKSKIANGIDVSALGGGDMVYSVLNTGEGARKVKISFPVGVDVLGACWLYYAYMRDPVSVDVSSYYTIGNDTTANNYYVLPPAEYGGTVSFSLLSAPDGAGQVAIQDGRIVNMTVNGNYEVLAVYTKDGQTIHQKAVITRLRTDATEGCNVPMANNGAAADNTFTVEKPIGSSGALLELFNAKYGPDNLVDANTDNYAECVSLLSLLQSKGIVAVQAAKSIAPEAGKKTRVGFVMQTSSQLLGADVLKFFFLRLYKDDVKVYEGLTDQNSTVGVGLVGNAGNKIRFSVETDKEFDRVELWTAGVLNLTLSTLRIYNAFYEPADCENITTTAEACLEMITAQRHGATVDYAETHLPQGVDVGSSINDLSYVLDNSQETYAKLISGVSALSDMAVSIRFRELKGGQAAGVIISNPAFLAGVSALGSVQLDVFDRNGRVVADRSSSSVASVDVIGNSGRAYIEVVPDVPFCEIRVSFPGVAKVGDEVFLHGFYTRADEDNNGIPDCAEDPDDSDNITIGDDYTRHVCVDADTQEGTVSFPVTSDTPEGTAVTLTCYRLTGAGEPVERTATLVNKRFEITLPVGDYSVSGFPVNGYHVQVHALQTTWKQGAAGTDWNRWDNWTDGSPWGCTKVVIPAGASLYPELQDWTSVDAFWGGNFCDEIHFEPGAEVVNTHYLEYNRAYVETILESGRYHALAAPLKGMVTGDMFVSTELPAYFTELTATTYPEVRHNPLVYQRMWSHTVETAVGGTSGNGTQAATADWSRPFNAVAQAYDRGQGFSLMVNKLGGRQYRFRFPKTYDQYNYYNLNGSLIRPESKSVHMGDDDGRFVYEGENFDPSSAGRSFSFTFTNEGASEYFIAGNPFMAHIDIREFLSKNTQVAALYIYKADGQGIKLTLVDGGLVSSTGEDVKYIAPMQGFFLSAVNRASNLTVEYTEDMLAQAPSAARSRAYTAAAGLPGGVMRITATADGQSSGCLLCRRAGASDGVKAGEDNRLLLDAETAAPVLVYTVADRQALDIQQCATTTRIPVGFRVRRACKAEVMLCYANAWAGWTLVDTATGRRYALDGRETRVELDLPGNADGRFYLEKN